MKLLWTTIKPKNNAQWAAITIAAGLLAALLMPWAFTQRNLSLLDFSNTGQIGDTIGGIAGPILNFAGLLIVYFSLKEQFIANEEQRRSLKKQNKNARRESNFNTALRLVDETKIHWGEHKKEIEQILIEEDKLM